LVDAGREGSVHVEFSSGLSREHRELAAGAALPELLEGALRDLGRVPAGVNCRLTTPSELRSLNRRFAGIDRSTDVLAFPAAEASPGADFRLPPGEDRFLGDVVISVATASHQAAAAQTGLGDELRLLAVHGLLHLLGQDHADRGDAAEMTATTRRLLSRAAARRRMPPPPVPELQPPGE
jgi:probable rRNA maturation factor